MPGPDVSLSFFSLLQNNVHDAHPWQSREEPGTAIIQWIERSYHRRTQQKELGEINPGEVRGETTGPGPRC